MTFKVDIEIQTASEITKQFLMKCLENMYDGYDNDCGVDRLNAYELVLEDFCLEDEFIMFIKEHATQRG